MAWQGTGAVFNTITTVQGGFSIGTPPTPAVPEKATLQTDLQLAWGGKDRYRPWIEATLDGFRFFTNGYDQPWWWDGVDVAQSYQMGSEVPTSFGLTEIAGTAWTTNGTVVTYYLVHRNSLIGKETAPQIEQITIASQPSDVRVTWTSPTDPQWDETVIYRVLQGSRGIVQVAAVASTSSPYDDSDTDSNIETNKRYVNRWRETLPPIFKGHAGHKGRLWGWVAGSTNLNYSQVARPDSEMVLDDFPTSNLIQIGAEDGLGDITAAESHYGALYVFKRRGLYAVEGEPGSEIGDVGTMVSTRLFADRGCVSPRTVKSIESVLYFLDEQGLYGLRMAGEPFIAGARADSRESPLANIWARLNLDAADYFWALHDEDEGELHLHVALDDDPVPLYRIVYDYRENRFTSIDGNVPGTAGGWLEDASLGEHNCRVDDLGILWEDGHSNTEGATAGTLSGDVTAATYEVLTVATAAFETGDLTGPFGTPVDVWDSSGELVTANRVTAVTATTLELLYFDEDTAGAADSLEVGVIPFLLETGRESFNVDAPKLVGKLFLHHEIDATSTIRVDKAKDSTSFTITERGGTGDLTMANKGVLSVPVHLRGQRHYWRIISRHPGMDFSLLGLKVHVRTLDLET